jgi:hypothetical protein
MIPDMGIILFYIISFLKTEMVREVQNNKDQIEQCRSCLASHGESDQPDDDHGGLKI